MKVKDLLGVLGEEVKLEICSCSGKPLLTFMGGTFEFFSTTFTYANVNKVKIISSKTLRIITDLGDKDEGNN